MSDPQPDSPGHHHRQQAPEAVPAAVVTVSDTRSIEDDAGGALVAELLEAGGHSVVSREIVRDEPEAIARALLELVERPDVGAVVFTGGTGVAPRDVTPDTLEPLLERVVPGFGELFRMLSYQEIGSAAMLSRALAGLLRGKVIFALPGSRGAVRLGMTELVVPELGHLAGEAVKRR